MSISAQSLAKAEAITGWIEPGELQWLAERAMSAPLICEVGSWQGRSTMALAEHCHGTVYAVDTWKGSPEHQDQFVNNPPDWCYDEFCKNLAEYIKSNRVIPIRADSRYAAKVIMWSLYFDMVFLDAAHEYEEISADFDAWLPRVRSGGIICGHDAGFEPVTRALNERLPQGWSQRNVHGIWSWQKP